MRDAARRLRFAAACAGPWLEGWQLQCLRELTEDDGAEFAACLLLRSVPEQVSRARRAGPQRRFALTEFFPRTNIIEHDDGDAAGDICFSQLLRGRLQTLELDFLMLLEPLWRVRQPDGISRCGIWAFRFNLPAGFWEVVEGWATTAAALVKIGAAEFDDSALREGHLKTVGSSARKNGRALLAECARWPALACRRLAVDDGWVDRCAPVDPKIGSMRRCPTPLERGKASIAQARNFTAGAWRRLFRQDQWNIGLVHAPIDRLLAGAPRDVRWLPQPAKGSFVADPFYAELDGSRTIFCEAYDYRGNRGVIAAIELGKDGQPQPPRTVLDLPHHLSYPYLLRDEGRLLCIPESSAAGNAVAYAVERATVWRQAATLLDAFPAVDSSVFEHEGLWWLACCHGIRGPDHELHLWYAADKLGPWTPHAGNPVKIDVRSARPAGTPFRHGGSLYRPAQDCSRTYGGRVSIQRIVHLTPGDFEECEAAGVEPDPQGPYADGLHTISDGGALTVIDGKRAIFSAHALRRIVIFKARQFGASVRDRLHIR